MFPEVQLDSVAMVNRDQMIEVDRVMIEDLGISLLQMMENAGRNLADLAIQRFSPTRVLVLAGSGGNGGGGLAAARHLSNRGVEVAVALTKFELNPVPAHQLEAALAMGIEAAAGVSLPSLLDADLVIDAIIGYSLTGPPRGAAAALITEATSLGAPILSLDVPSGVDVTTGDAFEPHFEATATMTLAAAKIGLVGHQAVGELYLADISVPPSVYAGLGLAMGNPFAASTLVRL